MGWMTEDTERKWAARHWAASFPCLAWLSKYVGTEHLSITQGIPGGDVDDDGITKEMVEEMQRDLWKGHWGQPRPDNVKNIPPKHRR